LKKYIYVLLACMVGLGIYTPSQIKAEDYDAKFCNQFKGQTKIWWDGVELKPGQIGRLFIEKDTPLFKLNGTRKSFSRTLKSGEKYRIYAFKPGILSVGGGYYVDRDTKVTYQTPSKTKLAAVKCINGELPAKISILGKVTLGMTKEQVKSASSGTLLKASEEELIFDSVNILGFPANVSYEFTNNKLVSVNIYHDVVSNVDDIDLLDAYFDVMYDKISSSYGEANVLDRDWYNDEDGYVQSAYWSLKDQDTLLIVYITVDFETYGGFRITIK
jgi:hypothetical protein